MNDNAYPRFSARYFFPSSLYSSPGWYFRVRGGHSLGPYPHKEMAVRAARDYSAKCQNQGDHGGRFF
jgi:hypothetical protein